VHPGVRAAVELCESRYALLGLDEVHLLTFSEMTPFGGLGLLGNVYLHEFVLWDDFAYIREQGVAHELAHSWWGGLASSGVFHEAGFLAEAFAEYSAWWALGTLQGDDVRTSGARMNAVWYMFGRPGRDDIAVVDEGVLESELYVFVTYHKGSVVLRTLEERVGPEAFAEALRAFVARGGGGLSVDALSEDLQAASGVDVSSDVEQWLRRPGYPELVVATAETAEGVVLQVEAIGDFRFRLPLRIELDDGATIEEGIDVEPGTTEHVLEAGSRVVRVQADPRWTLVRRVTPAVDGDVTLDGRVDAADLIEIALHSGGALPEERRVDGRFDPLLDVDGDRLIGRADLDAVAEAP
jgi:aminopeptidase N